MDPMSSPRPRAPQTALSERACLPRPVLRQQPVPSADGARAPCEFISLSKRFGALRSQSPELSTSHLHPCTSAVITDFLDTLICLKRRVRSQSRGVAEAPVRRAVVSAVLRLAPLAGTQGAGGGGGDSHSGGAAATAVRGTRERASRLRGPFGRPAQPLTEKMALTFSVIVDSQPG